VSAASGFELAEERVRALAHAALAVGRHGLRWASQRTGLPGAVLALLAGVLAFRVARRTWRVALELGLALAVLLIATHLGWIRW
jgi:hypothetical protein